MLYGFTTILQWQLDENDGDNIQSASKWRQISWHMIYVHMHTRIKRNYVYARACQDECWNVYGGFNPYSANNFFEFSLRVYLIQCKTLSTLIIYVYIRAYAGWRLICFLPFSRTVVWNIFVRWCKNYEVYMKFYTKHNL